MPEDLNSPPIEEQTQEEFGRRFLEQAFELWINPELKRRRDAGLLPEHFALVMAQQIQKPDGSIEVRINEEVRGIGEVSAKRDIQAGEDVTLEDLGGLQSFDLDDSEIDCGHWTVFWVGTHWFSSFNFLTHRGKCLSLLERASQFSHAAESARSAGHAAVAVDTLFSACELISKAELVASRVIELEVKSHGTISSRMNMWRRLGNSEGAFVDLFNKLGRLRPRYRYDASFSESMPISEDDIALVSQVIASTTKRLGSSLSDRKRVAAD